MDYTVHGILQARILEWVAYPFSRGSSQPRDQTQISHIAGGFFTIWATRETQEYWRGSLYLLQGIFLTQESNRDLLHCRQILYQLSYQESPKRSLWFTSCWLSVDYVRLAIKLRRQNEMLLLLYILSFGMAFRNTLKLVLASATCELPQLFSSPYVFHLYSGHFPWICFLLSGAYSQ